MYRLGDLTPRLYLLATVDTGRPGITLALHRHLRSLAYNQGGGCALRVVAGGEGAWHIAGLACPRTGQWRHDDAMRQVEGAKPVRLKQQVRVWRLSGTGLLPDRGHFVHFLSFRRWN